jgi:hypothetical protein
MTVAKADAQAVAAWDCVGGALARVGTHVTWTVEPTGVGVVVRLDHAGFAVVDEDLP